MRAYTVQPPHDDASQRDWTVRTTRQRTGRNAAMAAALVGILCTGISSWAVLAAGDRGLPAGDRAAVLVGGIVGVVLLAACAIATEAVGRREAGRRRERAHGAGGSGVGEEPLSLPRRGRVGSGSATGPRLPDRRTGRYPG